MTTAIAVLLAVVGATLVGVRERSETTRLRYRVLELERRRDALERQGLEIRSAAAAALAPRGLLVEHDRRRALAGADAARGASGGPEETPDLPVPVPEEPEDPAAGTGEDVP